LNDLEQAELSALTDTLDTGAEGQTPADKRRPSILGFYHRTDPEFPPTDRYHRESLLKRVVDNDPPVGNSGLEDLEQAELSALTDTLDTGAGGQTPADEQRPSNVSFATTRTPNSHLRTDTAAKSLLEQVVDKHPTWGQHRLRRS
jgi:hypothetical protein